MSERNILNLYNISNYLKVVRVIVDSPKTAKEITSAINMQEVSIADMLENLEKQRAAEYVDTKWNLTEIGKAVLTKFF